MGIQQQLQPRQRRMRIFLCYSHSDRAKINDLHKRLLETGFDVWWDKKSMLAGKDWQIEVENALRVSDIALVCLSQNSESREGFFNKEVRFVLDMAMEKPRGAIFLIPVRLDECQIMGKLTEFNWIDLFSDEGWDLLIKSLKIREAQLLGKRYIPHEENFGDNTYFEYSTEEPREISDKIEVAEKEQNHDRSLWDLIKLNQFSKIASELTVNVSAILRDLLRNNPGDVEKIAASQINLLTNYYSLVLNQAQRSFVWALIWATVGILVFIMSGAFLLIKQSSDIALIGSIGGAIVEVISGINFYLYSKASAQLSDFHVRLDATQKVLLSNAIAEKLEGELKQKTRSYLALKFAGVDVTPEFLKKELIISPNVRIMHIAFNPEGKDVTNEYVKIENIGSGLADMTDWVLQDNAGHKFKFPMFILKPSSSVLVWTKGGKNTPSNLFLKRKRAIWNNSSDCAYLKNSEGKLIDIYYYSNNKATESVLA